MNPDIAARVIGGIALVIAIVNIGVTVTLWQRSGPRLRVRLRREEHPRDRLVIEVSNVGRMAILVKELGLEDRISTGNTPPSSISYISMPVAPTDGKPAQRVLEHTDLPIVAEVPMDRVVTRWFGGRKLTLVAWAKDGNDHKKNSSSISFQTPQSTPAQALPTKGLSIIAARYGARDKWLDMKPKLEERIRDDRLREVVSNALAGSDPLFDVPKAIEVEYSIDGRVSNKTVQEGDELVLP
jgi:hypothetical protein